MPQINAAGLSMIKNFEGCRLVAYQDPAGVWTIGYGHTGDVTAGETISQQRADQLLLEDLQSAEQCVNDAVSHDVTPNQFAALVSFTYNVGRGAFQGSTLLKLVNGRDYAGAAQQFGRWVFAGGQELPGLVRRRQAEAQLFAAP